MSKVLLGVVAITMASCGSTMPPTPRPTPTPTARPTATPIPDAMNLEVVSTGIGVYHAVVVPVAVVRNAAARTGITGVRVHFSLSRGGRPLPGLDSPAVTLYPGETLAVTADCTDACNSTGTVPPPNGLAVTVVGGTWAPLQGSPLTSSATSFSCVSGSRG